MDQIVKVMLADCNVLTRAGLAALLNVFGRVQVAAEVGTGQEIVDAIKNRNIPDVLLVDIGIQDLNIYETCRWLSKNAASVKTIVLSSYCTEMSLITLMTYGINGFLKRDAHPHQLSQAIQAVVDSGYYLSHDFSGRVKCLFRDRSDRSLVRHLILDQEEIDFLKRVPTDLTYRHIARDLGKSLRTIDTIRDRLFIKFGVRSRVGLALYSIRQGLYQL